MSTPISQKYRAILSDSFGNKMSILMVFFLILAFSSCNIFNQTREYERFIHSRFSVRNVKVLSVAGIDVSQISRYSDLDFGQLITLGTQIVKGNLPSIMEITVEGHNSSSGKAAISGMDWLLQMKQDTLAMGTINRPIVIPPGQSVNFPVKVNFNLSRLIKSGSIEQILKVILENNNEQEFEKLELIFKIRPWYHLGKKVKKAPVYISIHPKFGQVNILEK